MDIKKLHLDLQSRGIDLHIDTLKKAKLKGYTSRKLALILEKATGTPRESWVFPEKFGNPWTDGK